MTAIPHELLAQIANPTGGSDNVLRMFMQGQQQAMQNDEWGRRKRHDNALLQAGPMIDRGEYGKAAGVMGSVGDTTAQLQFISMQQKQERDNRLKGLIEPQLGIGSNAASPPMTSGYVQGPPAGGYRGTIGGDGKPRMPQMPKSITRMGSQPTGNQALARALYASGDLEGAIKELYRDRATPDMVEYQLGVDQGYTGTFRQWQLEGKRAGANSVTVDMKGLSAEEESAGKERGSRMDALEAGNSIRNLQQIQLVGRLLENVDSGALAGLEGTAGNIFTSLGLPLEGLKYLGIDPNLVTTGPQIQALINRQIVGMIGSGQFPAQNFSDTDRIFLEKILPSLSNQPEANALITATTERMLQVETEKRQAWTEARKQKISYRDFEAQWNDMLQQQDIFGEIAKQAGAAGNGTGGASDGWSEVPGMPGVTIRKRGQ